MTFWQVVRNSLFHHRWMNLAVALGVATTTAVIVGALLVGDSVRGSLVDLTLERLGQIDLLLVNDRFFDPALVEEVRAVRSGDGAGVAQAEAMCLIPNVTVEGRDRGRVRGVLLVGRSKEAIAESNSDSSADAAEEPLFELSEDQIVINQALADDLSAAVGDELIVRLPVTSEVPAESPLGRKDGRVRSRTGLVIAAILPMRGWGQFQLQANQKLPRTAFVRDSVLQAALKVGQRVNAIAVKSDSLDRQTDTDLATALEERLPIGSSDVGFQVELVKGQFGDDVEAKTAWQYVQVTIDRMLFSDDATEVAVTALKKIVGNDGEPQTVFTYLANAISKVAPSSASTTADGIPYSTVAAVDPHAELGPYFDAKGDPQSIEPGQIVLNAWAANDLQAEVGDQIEIRYFAAETTHGKALEETETFKLAGILPLREPTTPFRRHRAAQFGDAPFWSNDPQLTPTVEGITDQDSIDDWDPPFPFDNSRVRDQDDEYWEWYRTTPKAFIALADGQRLWGSRFGQLTALRIPVTDDVNVAAVEAVLADEIAADPRRFGFEFRPVKLAGLKAARGTTPFEWLFLGFSMFLLFSALALTAILFRLAAMLRQKELGTMLATGWPADRASRTVMYEASLVALLGGIVGVLGGIAYAAVMLAGLRTWWLAAVVTPFIRLHMTWPAILFGFLAGHLASMLVVWWTLRKLRRAQPLNLLRGSVEHRPADWQRVALWPIGAGVLLAVALAVIGARLSGEAQAGCFFGGGAALLTSLLLIVRRRLRSERTTAGRRSLVELAQSSMKRNPSRSLLTTALMASATFLIVAISAFRLSPTQSGTGGFDWIGESDRPIFVDLNDGEQRRAEFGKDVADLDGAAILSLRVQAGDDASCRNLYQATRPRLLGVPPELCDYCNESTDSFSWAAAETPDCPWRALRLVDEVHDIIPVILDKNTAMFSLHLAGRLQETFTLDYDRPLTFRIVGLLSNSILQGSLLVDERELLLRFPEIEGSRLFLVSAPPGRANKVASALEARFNDEGLALRDSTQELTELMAVQNTYLSTFQTLGVLGLLLGAIGLAIVQMRNTIERRSELAAMQAIGFARGRLGRLIATETVMLLVAGLIVGMIGAMATVMPHMIFGDARVPLRSVAGMLGIVLVVGLLASWLAVSIINRLPLVDSLRRDA